MTKYIINILYKLSKSLLKSEIIEVIKKQILIQSVTAAEGYQKKLEVLKHAKVTSNTLNLEIKSYIISMVIDIFYVYMKENNIIR